MNVDVYVNHVSIGSDGTVYFGTFLTNTGDIGEQSFFNSVNPDSTINWSVLFSDCGVYTYPAIASDGTIYVVPNDPHLRAISSSGVEIWANSDVGCGSTCSPVVGADGTIYVNGSIYTGSYHVGLYSVSSIGNIKWDYCFGGDWVLAFEPTIDSEGTIYIGGPDEYLYAVNVNGNLRWRFKTEGCVYGSPAIATDGTLYCGSDEGVFYAFDTNSTGLATSPWPRVGHDNQNTGNAAWNGW
ncbi:PQQ-like beta-propeller repeat protein [candidate division WOR-3 bacterium]|nr:PQQ-like beta-propeller repeat protein [candidate division WOR-3 bacterium]